MGSWSGSSVERLLRGVLRRRKRLFLIASLIAMVVMLPVAFIASKEPPRYRATAVVLLEARPDRGVPVFQEMSPNRPFPVQMAILASRSLAETVVENLPKASLQELLETSYQTNFLGSLVSAYQGWRGIEPPAPNPKRQALAELQRARVSFQPWPDKSGIITISAEASHPTVSVDIINTYIEALMSRTRTFNIDDARVSREFLEQQLTDVKRTMNLSEQSLQAFVASHGGVRLPDQSKAAADRLGQTEAALAEAVSNRKMVETRLTGLREKVEGQKRPGDKAGSPAPRLSSPEVERLRNELAKLESSLLELRMKYTEEHPRIQLVKNRIDELTNSLGGALKDSVPSTPLASAVPAAERVNFSEQLIGLEATYHSMVAREEALTKQSEILRQSLRGLSGGEAEYARLQREVDSQRSLHAMLSDKLTAARIREQGEMKVVKVIDPPGPGVPAGNEKRLLALAVAFAAALGLGAAVPTGVEWLHRKIENEDDVELATGLPVLALVPSIRTGRPVFMSGIPDTTGRGPSDQLMFTEAFRALRVAIELSTRGEPLKRLLVTSAFAGDGKSTVVANLGYALSEAGHRVVLADTDFLRPTLHRTMKIKSSSGLVETLESETPLEPTLVPVTQGLWLAQRGESLHPRSRGLLAGSKLRGLIGEMSSRADFVICDSSPVLLIPDNLLLASAVDGVVLVAKAGVTGFRDLAKTK
ncbi:MAG TPA: Wzz/FepE/Etk N-terminal domain-containing protein, partial [Gemmatimonadales bacterium]|nr:Wzz/FepE/Etk N-terminal domain-containing protein [Gemmatimonadales bacterium]